MASTTVNGMKYSDQLAALLDHAIANGWRIEPNPREKPNGAIAYPPDKDHGVIRFSEKGAKFNRAHYENVRRDFYRAGLTPLPADIGRGHAHVVEMSEEDVAALPPDVKAVGLHETFRVLADHDSNALTDMLEQGDSGHALIGVLVEGLSIRAGLGEKDASFAATVTSHLIQHLHSNGEAAISAAMTAATSALGREVNEALSMAAEAEARAEREAAAATKADERERKAREDCAAALRRAEAAEKAAAEAQAALAPLRAYLTAAEG